MNWTQLLKNPEAIAQIFGSAPSLEQVKIAEIVFHEDGPRLLLRFDVTTFPTNPPEKWLKGGFNQAQLRLMCLGVRSVTQRGWGTTNRVDIDLSVDEPNRIRLITRNGQLQLDALFDILVVDGVTAYRNDA